MDKHDVRSIVKAIEDLTREVKAGNQIALDVANRPTIVLNANET